MKRIALVSCSVCLILAVIYFFRDKKEVPTKKVPVEVKIDKKLDIKRDKQEEAKTSKKSAAPADTKQAKETKTEPEVIETPEQKEIKKSLVKRNKFYKNSHIEVVNIDKIANRSSVIIRTRHEGQNYSFSALIDNETGKILKTWGRTIFERRK